MRHNKKGFTLIEIVVAIGVLLILYFLNQNTSIRPQQSNSLNAAVDTLVVDISSQQAKSMNGDTSVAGVSSSYGVHFSSDRYVLFRGSSYNASATDNFTVRLDDSLQFSVVNLPSSNMVFASGSGTLANYDAGQNSVTVYDTANNVSKSFQINSYGVIYAVQ